MSLGGSGRTEGACQPDKRPPFHGKCWAEHDAEIQAPRRRLPDAAQPPPAARLLESQHRSAFSRPACGKLSRSVVGGGDDRVDVQWPAEPHGPKLRRNLLGQIGRGPHARLRHRSVSGNRDGIAARMSAMRSSSLFRSSVSASTVRMGHSQNRSVHSA